MSLKNTKPKKNDKLIVNKRRGAPVKNQFKGSVKRNVKRTDDSKSMPKKEFIEFSGKKFIKKLFS